MEIMEDRVAVYLPLSYLKGLVIWIEERISTISDLGSGEIRLLQKQKEDFQRIIISYEIYQIQKTIRVE